MPQEYPLLIVHRRLLFPSGTMFFDLFGATGLVAVDAACEQKRRIVIALTDDEEPQKDSKVREIGTLARIRQVIKLPDGHARVLIEGVSRVMILHRTDAPDYPAANVLVVGEEIEETAALEALWRTAHNTLEAFSRLEAVPGEIVAAAEDIKDKSIFADTLAMHLLHRYADSQKVYECVALEARYELLLTALEDELAIAQLEQSISSRVRKQMDKNQREYVLRERLRAIRTELGEEGENEIDALKAKAKDLPLSDEMRTKVQKEIARLEGMPPSSHEATVSRTWLDWVLSLPWKGEKKKSINIRRARRILERDHYGLEKVKERVLEFLAVAKLQDNDLRGPILCLVGPPGVGKTSIGRSIAECMQRKFVRMSLGGVRDEAEIRGHRRTYIGAVPGRILTSLRQVGVNDPLMLLDEIDKLSHDALGDPSSALLEVLDGEQNHSFQDHYLEAPFDLSKVLFIATANNVDTIPRPLLDRMELIECPGYTDAEKAQIAKRHLLPRQLEEHGLTDKQCNLTAGGLKSIIEGYTRESGVRQLERNIAAVCRKVALQIAEGQESMAVTADNITDFLGRIKYIREEQTEHRTPGVATGLAWTAVGGETLPIEVLRLPGNGKLVLTGQLGEVMQESAQTAASLVRHTLEERGIELDFSKEDWHVHIPEGAVSKDGPSAGITMAVAMLSACLQKPIKSHLAMTGELTLTGRVLAVGGIKEKVLAAARAGAKTIIMPRACERDIEEIPESIAKKLKFIFVEKFAQVAEASFS